MIEFEFAARSGQGELSGFDLGDMRCAGEMATTTSAGRVPDQGMMIYLSIPLLLDDFIKYIAPKSGRLLTYHALDSRFELKFAKSKKDEVAVFGDKGKIGSASTFELASAILQAVDSHLAGRLHKIPEDSVRLDLMDSLKDFRDWCTHVSGSR